MLFDPRYFAFWTSVFVVLSILLGVTSAYYAYYLSKQRRTKRAAVKNQVAAAQIALIEEFLKKVPKTTQRHYIDYFVSLQYADGSFADLGETAKETVEEQANHIVTPLKLRLEEIEKRFPKESTIEKVASVNDAILATKIEELAARIQKMEDKQLSKWDIAVVVFEIIGIIVGVGGLIAAIFQYIAALR